MKRILLFLAVLWIAFPAHGVGFGPGIASWPSASSGGGGSGTGDVSGPVSATPLQAAIFADPTGKALTNAPCTFSITGVLDCPPDAAVGGGITLKNSTASGNAFVWVLKLPDTGVTGGDKAFEINADGTLPAALLPAPLFSDLLPGTGALIGAGDLIIGAGTTLTPGGGTITASTANELTLDPSDCAGGEYATAIGKNGDLTCATPTATASIPTCDGQTATSACTTAGDLCKDTLTSPNKLWRCRTAGTPGAWDFQPALSGTVTDGGVVITDANGNETSSSTTLASITDGLTAVLAAFTGSFDRVVDLTNGITWAGIVPTTYTNPALQLQEAFNPGFEPTDPTYGGRVWKVRSLGKATIYTEDCFDGVSDEYPIAYCVGFWSTPVNTTSAVGFSGGAGSRTGWPLPTPYEITTGFGGRTAASDPNDVFDSTTCAGPGDPIACCTASEQGTCEQRTVVDSVGSISYTLSYSNYLHITAATDSACVGQKRKVISIYNSNTFVLDSAWPVACNPSGATYTIEKVPQRTQVYQAQQWYSDGTELNFDLRAGGGHDGNTKPVIGLLFGNCWFEGFDGTGSASCSTSFNYFERIGSLIVRLVGKETSSTGWTNYGRPIAYDADETKYFDADHAFVAISRDQMTRSTIFGNTLIDGGYKYDSVAWMSRNTWGSNVLGGLQIRNSGTGMQFFSNNVSLYETPYVTTSLGLGVVLGTHKYGGENVVSDTCWTTYCGSKRGGGSPGANGILFEGGVIEGNPYGEIAAFDVRSTKFDNVHIENGTRLGHMILLGAGQCTGGATPGKICAEDAECGAGTCPLSNPSGEYANNGISLNLTFEGGSMTQTTNERWASVMIGKNARDSGQRVMFTNMSYWGPSVPYDPADVTAPLNTNSLCTAYGTPAFFCLDNGHIRDNTVSLLFRMPMDQTQASAITSRIAFRGVSTSGSDSTTIAWPYYNLSWDDRKNNVFSVATCSSGVASTSLDMLASGYPTPTCRGDTNVPFATLDFPYGSLTRACVHYSPPQWAPYSPVDVWLTWAQFDAASPTGNAFWKVSSVCKSESDALNAFTLEGSSASDKRQEAPPAQYKFKRSYFPNIYNPSCGYAESMYLCVDRLGNDGSDTFNDPVSLLELRIDTMTP